MLNIKRLASLFILASFFLTAGDVYAENKPSLVITTNRGGVNFLADNDIYTYISVERLEVKSSEPLYGLYIKYDRVPTKVEIAADGAVLPLGSTGYLHSYIALDGVKEVAVSYENAASVADVFAFTDKEPPPWVQRWETADRADIMVCPTHSDDEQLYFAGLIPWCVAMGYKVQVVYLTNHLNTHDRPHELLDGLWHCGVRYCPIISDFPDLYSMGIENARAVFGARGYKDEDFTDFYIDVLQRCKPLVVVAHDFGGEYGHGAHMLNAALLTRAVELSAERGLWNVPKTYVHLWNENASVFNWDEPLEFFGGKSAFRVSQEAFGFHKSQQIFTSLTRWLYGTADEPVVKASQIGVYSPCRFGLYRSEVGADTGENPLFWNLRSYRDIEREGRRLRSSVCMSGEGRRRSLLEAAAPFSFGLPHIVSAKNADTPDETPSAAVPAHSKPVGARPAKREVSKYYGALWLCVPVIAAVLIATLKRKKK